MKLPSAGTTVYQFVTTLLRIPSAIRFSQEHRLWKGIQQYAWVAIIVFVASLFFSLKIGTLILEWWRGDLMDTQGIVLSGMGNLATSIASEGYELFTAGWMKYVILILLEVIVFHFVRRTLFILTGKDSGTSFDDFFKAQVRMFVVVVRSWAMEMVASILITIFFSIFGFLDIIEPVLLFGVQCYYLGFAILDNYNEQFELTIKESVRYAQDYIGVSLALGLVLYIILLVPVLGPIVGPIIVSITAAIIMVEQSDLHLVGKEEALGIEVQEETDDIV